MHHVRVLWGLVLVAGFGTACGRGNAPSTAPRIQALSAAQIDSMWVVVEQTMADRKYDRAGLLIERFLLQLPFGDPRIPQARMMLGEAYLASKSNLLAVREFRSVADQFSNDSLAPRALLRAGDAHAGLWRRPELDPTDGLAAMAIYQEMLGRYPNAPAADDARLAIGRLEEMFAAKGLKAARYYMRYKAYDSALIYLRDILANYPQSSLAPEVLAQMIGVYRILDNADDVVEACTYFRRQWPAAPQLAAACPVDAVVEGGGAGH